jgi:hypothetical protein
VVKGGSQGGVSRGSGATTDSTLPGDVPLDGAENGCCMATGWADGMAAVHSCACLGPNGTNHDPETLYALPGCVTELH